MVAELQVWYSGIVDSVEAGGARVRVHFDDGEREAVDLALHAVRWHAPNGAAAAAAARTEAARIAKERASELLAAAQAAADERAATAPATVQVICNGMTGELAVRESVVQTQRHGVVSPTEFERLAGKGSAKKWKVRLPPAPPCRKRHVRRLCSPRRTAEQKRRARLVTDRAARSVASVLDCDEARRGGCCRAASAWRRRMAALA